MLLIVRLRRLLRLLLVPTSVITVSNEEETQVEAVAVSVAAQSVTITAPTVSVAPTVSLGVTFDTVIAPYETQQPGDYETDPLLTVVNWEANRIDVLAPTATL